MNFLSVIDQSANLLTIKHTSQTHLYKIPPVISLYPFRSIKGDNEQAAIGRLFYSLVGSIQFYN